MSRSPSRSLGIVLAVLASPSAFAAGTIPPAPPPIVLTGDEIVILPSGATVEIRDGASLTVTKDGTLVQGGTLVIKGGSVLISPLPKKDSR